MASNPVQQRWQNVYRWLLPKYRRQLVIARLQATLVNQEDELLIEVESGLFTGLDPLNQKRLVTSLTRQSQWISKN